MIILASTTSGPLACSLVKCHKVTDLNIIPIEVALFQNF
jgi:hypothetical protein